MDVVEDEVSCSGTYRDPGWLGEDESRRAASAIMARPRLQTGRVVREEL